MSDAHDPKHSGMHWSRSRRYRVAANAVRSADDLASSLISHMQRHAGLTWQAPYVTKLDDTVVLEWWHDERKITVDIQKGKIEYTRVWGADIDTEMSDGELSLDLQGANELWDWLVENTRPNV